MEEKSSAALEAQRDPYVSSGYRWYGVGVLMLVFTCHALDRSLPNILVEPVRHEFHLSDSQLGAFSGLAFALAFSISVLPAGYVGDRVNRKNFLAIAILVWSALTAVCGFARHYVQLLVARLGVGAAEATAAPLVLPMLADIAPADRRAFAFGVLYISNPIGLLIANIVGGYIAAEYGWRTAFFLVGAPGALVAAIVMLTLREPRRGRTDQPAAETPDAPLRPAGAAEAFAHLLKAPALSCLITACATMGLLNIAINAWMSSFFIRLHGVSLKEVGLILGLGAGLCGMVSPPAYGWLADRFAPRDHRWPMRLVASGVMLAMGFFLAMLFTPSLGVSIACFIGTFLLLGGYAPPLYTVLTDHTPARIRSSTMSILQLASNIVGFGLGPLVTGGISDLFGGGAAIRYALATLSVLFVLAATLLMLAAQLLERERRAQSQQGPAASATAATLGI